MLGSERLLRFGFLYFFKTKKKTQDNLQTDKLAPLRLLIEMPAQSAHGINFSEHDKYDWIYKNRVNTLHHISYMHLDFTTLNGLKITPGETKNVKKSKKRKYQIGGKKSGISFYFYTVYYGELQKEQRLKKVQLV